ncbi:uncharacterized protein LOC132571423 [Heteronotia binoei]|uniref:uncharacterized protein LOC132571423 n=1 Tax=Heteronotia binoei TaxID=13085 RepID=UPI002930FCEB|nr:uncharacterized protein LOC132571423 [Heteronotia binoei]XP_060094197.1 uncharacterized protein LOC132571423 [Heteronotia binoei]
MVAGRKKKNQKKRVLAGPTAMEVQDLRQFPLAESLHRQPPPGGPRTAMDMILLLLREVSKDTKQLRAGQDSLLAEMAELRTSIGQMNQWLDLAETRFSSLEDRACETHQTNSVMSASQSDPTASPSSFSSHQMILDAVRTAASPGSASVYSGDASSEPAPPSSEHFRTASSTRVYSETEKTAHIEAEESGQQEDTFWAASTEPQLWTSKLPETPQPPSLVEMQKEAPWTGTRLSRRRPTKKRSGASAPTSAATSAGALGRLVSSPPKEVMSPTKRPQASIVWRYFTKHPTSKFIAACNICGVSVKTGKIGGCGRVGTSALLKHMKSIHHIAQEKAPSVLPAAISKMRTASKMSNTRRPSAVERLRRTGSAASVCTATAEATRRSLASSPPAKVMSLAKRPRASIAWRYFTKHPTSKFIATCNICGVDVKTGKIGGCGRVGTAPLLSHIKRIHHIARKK